jgi:hypothetical protein
MYVRSLVVIALLAAAGLAQEPGDESGLKSRTEVGKAPPRAPAGDQKLWIIPAGARIPIQLRQPISTKTAQPGDPVYAQTTFPVVSDGNIAIPAGTWVQGVVDGVKRAGRLKGTAELQFHLTRLIYPNGYTLDIAAAIAQVPGDPGAAVREPGAVKQNPEKGKDLERVGEAASRGGQIGALAGAAAHPSIRGFGVGGLSGVAAGTLIALLARGSDVKFDAGTAVEISLSRPMAVDPALVLRPANTHN